MADSKFSNVRALVQGGSLTNLATASPWTVSHFGGTGLTLTAASRIRAESGSIGRAATLCAEAVASLDMALVGSTVLAAGRATLVVGASGNQLACELDGVQVGSLYLPLSSQRALFAIEYGPDGANENYFFRATGESSGGTVTTTASVSLTASAGSAGNLVVAGGPLIGTAPATPSHGTVNVATTRPGVLANAVPHIVSFSQANAAAGFTDRQAASTGGSLSITASRAGSADVTYTITNTAGLTLAGMCSVLVVGIAGLIGGSTSFLSGASRVTTATTATGANWLFLLSTPGLSFPAEPGTPIAATTVTGTGLVVPQVVQGGVYGAIGASVTQRDVISLSLPAANASMSLSVALHPALNATASMANIATGLDSLVAQIGAVGFTASWQQIGTDQYVINTERQTPGGFTLSASLSIDTSWIPNPITTLHAMRVTTAARYTAVGGVPDEFPTLPWPTTSIPAGGGGGGQLPTDVWLALGFENGSATDLSTYAHTKLTQDQVTLQTTGSRTNNGYAVTTGTAAALNYDADLNELNGLSEITVEFDVYVPESGAGGAYFFGAAGSDCWYLETAVGVATITPTSIWSTLATHPITLATNAWHHVAWSADAVDAKSFLGGVTQSTGTGINTLSFTSVVVAGYNFSPLGVAERPDLATLPGLRMDNVLITKRRKYTANFTPPGAITGGGTGWGTLPADVIFAVNAESNGNDVAQFGLSATASGTATIQASGSRTSDGYLRNTDSAQGADACFGYTPSAGFKSAWGAAQSMTLEFDIRVDTGAFLGGQILGIGSGYTALSGGGSTGSFLGGSPFATSAGSAELTVGAWHHIAFVADYNAGDRLIRTYRDGVQQGPAESVASFGFADYPNPTTIGLLQLYAGFIGNGALKGGMDNIVLTTRAKYTANFTPGASFPEIVGYTPPPSNVDVTAAGYNDLDAITGTGTFNTQLTAPDAYFFSSATLDDSVSTGDAYTVDGNSINFTGPRTLANTTCTGTFVYGTPQNFDSDVTLDDTVAVSTFYCDVPVEWTGSATLEDVTSFGIHATLAPATFTGSVVLDDISSSVSGFDVLSPTLATVNATVPVATLVSRVTRTYVDAMVPAAQLSASIQFMRVAAVVPVAELNARIQYIRVDATVPAATLVARAWPTVVNATVPVAELAASITPYVGAALDATVPAATLSAWGGTGLVATVPMAMLSASATVVNTLRLDAGLPRTTLAGFMTTGGAFRLDANVAVPTLSSWTGAQLDGTVPVATGFASAMFGGSFLLNASVPMATAEIGASSINLLSLSGTVPVASRDNWLAVAGTVPSAGVFASMSQVVATTTVAYNFTMANAAMTRYPAYPFTQVIRMGNTYYGVAPDGLYELGGETDNGTAIPWSFETCMDDFKEPKKKTVASVFIGGKVPANMTVTTKTGDLPSGADTHTTNATAVLRNHRQKLGLGRRSRFFAFGLSAPQGATQIEDVTFEVATTTRRM